MHCAGATKICRASGGRRTLQDLSPAGERGAAAGHEVGPGAHVGFYDYYDHDNHVDGTFIGIDGVLGLDYKFNGAPINVSIDWQPSFEFGDYVGFSHYGGIGIRYTF